MKVKSGEILINLDASAAPVELEIDGSLFIRGWAISHHTPIARVEVRVDDQHPVQVTHGELRQRMSQRFPDEPFAHSSGFAGRVNLGGRVRGSIHIGVTVTDQQGRMGRASRSLEIVDTTAGAGSAREALIYIHLPKTAGTSIRALAELVYPAGARLFIYNGPAWFPLDEVRRLPKPTLARAQFVMGHFYFGMHELLPQPARYVTMVRHPVDRILSLYHHFRRYRQDEIRDPKTTDTIPLEGFLAHPKMATRNAMVRMLSGSRNGLTGERLLELALRNIDERFVDVLVMEEREESMKRLGRLMGRVFSDLPRKNVNETRPRGEIPAELRRRIEEQNALDLELYTEVKRRFDSARSSA